MLFIIRMNGDPNTLKDIAPLQSGAYSQHEIQPKRIDRYGGSQRVKTVPIRARSGTAAEPMTGMTHRWQDRWIAFAN
ncbi:hypothetical protein NAC44_09150 [Allorhizobium sp. BGMRC 0089]|uniref:hypothetical protein n=1 Tax=Allorhizobium sonneratiae TaxID=2934936 RepID=UPI002033736D|nr:hypothetical protein [Allorhizobium sonneratiae]MCM2292497.1 hypothetical protein [Allorhizobium sonneratiae]